MKRRPRPKRHARRLGFDYIFLIYFALLLVFGLVMLTSASSAVRVLDPYFFIKRQLLLGVIPGILGCIVLSVIPYEWLKRFASLAFIGSIVLLIAVFLPGIGSDLNTGVHSWIVLFGYSFQPVELAKLGLIFFLAIQCAHLGRSLDNFKESFLPLLIVSGIPIGLVVLQPDIGSASILIAILVAIFFAAGVRLQYMAGLGGLAVIGLILLILVAPYRLARLTTFLDPSQDLSGAGYQINQAEIAIGSGGVLGRGLGHSRQKHQYLPEVHADSIFAIMSEEMGFVVVTLFLLLLLLIARHGFAVARRTDDVFGKLLVVGIMTWFMAQSFLNIGAIVGIMPLTGVPLPFVSHGGTALAIALAAVGILLNVARQTVGRR